MFIKKIKFVENYRNLSGLEFVFDKKTNFIVGDNNIGKTNLIELLNDIIRIGKFYEHDFADIKEPVKVIFQIEYNNDELGFFENNFDIDNELTITITAIQDNVDTRIEYYHTGSETYISPKTIRMLNFIYYSSLRSPNKELSFTNNTGTGKVLNYIMKKGLESEALEQMDLLKEDEINNIIIEINSKFEKLNGLSSEKIQAFLSDDKENIINRLLEIGDITGKNISKLGDGLQYSFNIFLNILEILVHLKTTKKSEDFENLLIKDEEGDKYLPIILGLDEPEIHQHPYRQRALIKSIQKIINNKNDEFLEIIKELFGVDGFIGQVFIATHSSNILLDDYQQIIRLYRQGTNIKAISGNTLNFDEDVHKHLKRSFIYFKEAMFAKSVILVEGDTEYGAVPVFAERLNCGLDEEGIGVVKLDGADGVLKYLELFNAYKINAIAILDKDKESTYAGNQSIKFTSEEDFEKDVFNKFSFKQYLNYLKSVNKHGFLIRYLCEKVDNFDLKKFMENPIQYEISDEIGQEIMNIIREDEIKKLRGVKNAINGALLANYVDTVPQSFSDVINYSIGGF